MVYKLNKKLEIANQKILKLQKGEKVDFDNEICANCSLVKEEKKVLEEKIEELLNEIKEKNETIEELKDNEKSESSEDSEEVKGKIGELYKKIKEQLESIKQQNNNYEIDKIQENIVYQNQGLNDIIEKYNKELNKENLFNEMNNLMKMAIKPKNENKYESIYNEYVTNLDKILKEENEYKTNKNISDKDQLNIFSINYFYDYLQSYFSYQLLLDGYQKLKIDNTSLLNMTKTLFSIVDDILASNYEMATTNNIQNATYNLIKTNFLDQNNTNNNLLQDPNPQNMNKRISVAFNNGLNQFKVFNKKNLMKRSSIIITQTVGGNANLANNNNLNNVNINFGSNIRRRTSVAVPIIPRFNPTNIAKNSMVSGMSNEKSGSFISQKSDNSDKNQMIFMKTEKKQTKLTLIKDMLVANIRKSEDLRKELFDTKDDFNKIIQFDKDFFTNLILNKEDADVEKIKIKYINNYIVKEAEKKMKIIKKL